MSELTGNLSRTTHQLRRTDEMLEAERAERRRASERVTELTDRVMVKEGTIDLHERWMTLLEKVIERLPDQ